ncbi:MFS transporter [Defluviimonas sp. WL0002]|uniref:MFS transporter n=1 Tax=Albidovulum marisflavi TaxID=2984159 RepID=A0ABT2ZA62_9RHOB|nr:MFS transporter [Defluviimonas sp. WL0002]MCV2867981.1 MFS transporter [Defluviimonas sp. WL0002]
MIGRYIPTFLRHAPVPGVQGFALLAGIEAAVRGILTSVWPLVIYQALGDAEGVSRLYFYAGILSFSYGMLLPWIGRFIARRWLYSIGMALYIAGPGCAVIGGPLLTPVGLLLTSWATMTSFTCINAYLLDFIARQELGRVETRKLSYSAISWTIGPMSGVWLWKLWEPLPFLIAMGFTVILTVAFWAMRMGNGKTITRARTPAPNPLAFLGRFFAQPRLVAGWLFAVLRSVGWWVYIVYLPIYCIEAGLGDQVASFAYSISNAFLFLSPLMLRWMQRRGLRRSVIFSFGAAAGLFVAAGFAPVWPPLSLITLLAASFFLVMLDTFGGLPFLMAVRPAERSEMAAVYASFRDVSGILTPGFAWLVLLVSPVPGVFIACGAGLAVAASVATRLHPRLGARYA